jgi:hypothetical protein
MAEGILFEISIPNTSSVIYCMILISQEEFLNLKKGSRTLMFCKCDVCSLNFKRERRDFTKTIQFDSLVFCSKKCFNIYQRGIKIKMECKNCLKQIEKLPSYVSKNNFCSRSCAATYNNKNKTHGTRRSKLECFIEKKLNELYPDLEIHYNKKDTINSELDIYIPSFKLAFELNGIFHYEPIYGEEKLTQITNNDNRKFQACLEKGIELCILDTSQQNYFSEKKSLKYLKIITDIIDLKNGGS